MAFNRLSTVACPFSPKCILSKGFFFGFFFRIFAPLILERTHGKLWIRHIWSCEIEKKRSLKKRRRGKKENAHDGLFGRIVQSVYFYVQNHYFSYNLIFGFETCPNTVDNKMEQIVQLRESVLNLPLTKFFEIFQIQRTERSNILFHFSTVYLKTTTLHVRTSLIFTFIS